MQSVDKWDRRFMRVACEVASWSKDPHTQVGAVLVRDRRIIATGYNGPPAGVPDLPQRFTRENGEKYFWMEHAERAALYDAARRGVSVEGSTLYVTLCPCADCARGVVAAGIHSVIYVDTRDDTTSRRGREILDSAQVNHQKMSMSIVPDDLRETKA